MDVIVLGIVTCGAQVLVIRRAQIPADGPDLVWAFPGGKVRDGEDSEDVAPPVAAFLRDLA